MSACPVETRRSGSEAVRETLGGREPDAQSRERARPRADDDAGQPRRRMFCSPQEPSDGRQQRLTVAVARRPGRQSVDPAVGVPVRDDDAVVAVSMARIAWRRRRGRLAHRTASR
jgi:hypothetical protein